MDFPLASTFGERAALSLQTPDDFHRQRLRINKRLNTLRRKLNMITKDTRNYSTKNKTKSLTEVEYEKNPAVGDLLLFQAERDVLYAQETKLLLDVHFSRAKEQFIKIKYRRALNTLKHLISIMKNEGDQLKKLEILTYAALIRGLLDVTSKRYSKIFASFGTAKYSLQFLYSKQELPDRFTKEFYLDIIELVINPALKVAELQTGEKVQINISDLASEQTDHSVDDDLRLSNAINIMQSIDSSFLTRYDHQQVGKQTISWSTYTVEVEREEVAAAIAKINDEVKNIVDDDHDSYDISMALYDDAIALQNAEIKRNKKDMYDSENQEQYIILTYLNYNTLLLRIRRDIAMINSMNSKYESKKNASRSKTLLFWRNKMKAIDNIIASVSELKSLPGMANDDDLTDFSQTLETYFVVQKQMLLANAYLTSNQYLNSLALIADSSKIISASKPFAGNTDGNLPTNADLEHMKNEVAEMKLKVYKLASYFKNNEHNRAVGSKYVVDNLDRVPKYSPAELIKNIAPTAIDFQPVNVKPVLFDIAYNYIGYDDSDEMDDDSTEAEVSSKTEEEKKKGFFGIFGR